MSPWPSLACVGNVRLGEGRVPKSWAIRIVAVLLVLAVAGPAVRPVGAQDAVWNLRTPEWKAAWAMLPAGGDPDLKLIAIASQLAAYSGSFRDRRIQPLCHLSAMFCA